MRSLSAALFLLSWTAPAWAQDAGLGSWTDKVTGPALHSHGVVASGGYLYAYGGRYVSPSGTHRFDPVANAWETLPDMPVDNYGFAAATHQGVCYAFGNGVDLTGAIYAFDTASSKWAPLSAALSVARRYAAAAALGDRIYVCGGRTSSSAVFTAALEEFDPATGVVRTRQPMPAPSAAGMMGAIGGRLYYAGGYDTVSSRTSLYEYDPGGDQWTAKAPMPVRQHSAAAFVLDSRLFIAGGVDGIRSPYVFSDACREYSPAGDVWRTRAALPAPGSRHSFGGGALGGRGYVFGGRDGRTNSVDYNVCQEFSPPDYGLPPEDPREPGVTTASGRAPSEGDRINETTLDFSVKSRDPDGPGGNGPLYLEVEIGRPGTPFVPAFRAIATTERPDVEGTATVRAANLGEGDWIWRCRVADSDGNSNPGGWIRFGTGPFDFSIDISPPGTPTGLSPDNVDINFGPPAVAQPLTEFTWTNATEADAPVGHEIWIVELRRDLQLHDVGVWSVDGSPAALPVPPGPLTLYWSVRSRDAAGNFSDWSVPLSFRVVVDDGSRHAAGDAERVMGCSTAAGTRPGSLLLLLIAPAAAAAAIRRRTL